MPKLRSPETGASGFDDYSYSDDLDSGEIDLAKIYGFDGYDSPDSSDQAEASLPSSDGVKLYQKEIAGIPIPDPVEVRQLADIIRNGENAEDILETLEFAEIPLEGEVLQIKAKAEAGRIAQERLFTSHLRFAAHVARQTMGWGSNDSIKSGARIKNLAKFAADPLPLADRIQAANDGLMQAASNYKAEVGANFTTYAMWRIEQAIELAIIADHNVKVPVNVVRALTMVTAYPEALDKSTFPHMEALGYLGHDPQTQKTYIQGIRERLSFDQLQEESQRPGDTLAVQEGDVPPTFYEAISDGCNDVSAVIEERDRTERLLEILETLPERERKVIKMRFGFEGEPATLEGIGQELNVTRERIKQIESKALARMAGYSKMMDLIYESRTSVGSVRGSYGAVHERPQPKSIERGESLKSMLTKSLNFAIRQNKLSLDDIARKSKLPSIDRYYYGYGHWALGVDESQTLEKMGESRANLSYTNLLYRQYLEYVDRSVFLTQPVQFNAMTISAAAEEALKSSSTRALAGLKTKLFESMQSNLEERPGESPLEQRAFRSQSSFDSWLDGQIQAGMSEVIYQPKVA
ncbi:MAG: polymerase, sigma 70 subunit, RpoD [Candidatus Saccharibacteria bacterium]|nr:polymerase, sigma 70 subunit, RpoD [Candidatus Saccharibacteria bacterium]